MLKKIQNLLFEDEEIIEEEEIGGTVPEEPVVQVKKEEAVAPVEAKEPEQPGMHRIDVTQPIPVQAPTQPSPEPVAAQPLPESVFQRPEVQEELNATSEVQLEQEPQKPTLGITVDGGLSERPNAKTNRPDPSKKPARKPNVYEFQPVISPIFGVDEKDLNALQTSGKTGRTSEKSGNISPVISPMYGAGDMPVAEQRPVEPEKPVTPTAPVAQAEPLDTTKDRTVVEDDIPEFSLDDILKVRDEEFTASNTSEMPSLFDDDHPVIDETIVVDRSYLDRPDSE